MNKSARTLAGLFTVTGFAHLIAPKQFERIVPPALGHQAEFVLVSGVAELAIAVALTRPSTQRQAAIAATALLIAVFPANVYMAVNPATTDIPNWLSWARLPMQAPLIWWAWHLRKPSSSR